MGQRRTDTTHSLPPAIRNTHRKSLEIASTLATLAALVVPVLVLAGTTLSRLNRRGGNIQQSLHVTDDSVEIALILRDASKSADDSILRVNKNYALSMET